ncbi:MAG: flagellar basal body rod protein FlgF [Betaproteobacteria bacterium]|nr:flagellar basal body rod protein FlgF [Betaproteobacteria bacterium]
MDRLIYTAMTGASHILERQSALSSNLANVNTTAYKGGINAFKAIPLNGEGAQTRTFVTNSTVGYDFTPGALQRTGRSLDVGLNGKGWIAVLLPDGSEAYTRDGNLQVSANGILQTHSGYPVIDDTGQPGPPGQIAIPADSQVTVGSDGTISTVPTGVTSSAPSQVTTVGRLKLVNPPESQLVRGQDGLFRTQSGKPAPPDSNVTVTPNSLEGSNVNAIGAMVDMISIARQFEMQMQMLKTAADDSQQASQLLNITG